MIFCCHYRSLHIPAFERNAEKFFSAFCSNLGIRGVEKTSNSFRLNFYSPIFSQDDTISPIYGVGKPTAFKKLILNKHLREVALVFTTSSQSSEEIESAGNKAMSITFNSLRHKQFIENVLQPNSMLNRNLYLQPNQLQVP